MRLPAAPTALFIFACVLTAASAPYRIDTVAGSSMVGDGGPAVQAALRDAESISLDSAGNIYVADAGDHRVRRISTGGVITTVAGTGFPTTSDLNLPYGVTVDPSGNIFIADLGNNRVRRVDPMGNVTTVASGLSSPRNVLADGAGNVYIAEFAKHRVSRLDTTGTLTIVAGTGMAGISGDGGAAVAARLNFPAGMALDRAGNLYIADSGNNEVRKVSVSGVITTVLGSGPGPGASSVQLDTPTGVAVDSVGTLFIADSANKRIRRLTSAGIISTISIAAHDVTVDATGNLFAAAGAQIYKVLPNGAQAVIGGDGSWFLRGDNGPAISARLFNPSAVVVDPSGALWIADKGNSRIRTVSPAGIIATTAGPAGLSSPAGITRGSTGDLLIADASAASIFRLSGAALARVAGNGTQGYTGEGFLATGSSLYSPADVVSGPDGSVYIADAANNRIRRVNPGGVLLTVAGTGIRGWNGDSIGTATQIDTPGALALDSAGALYFADTGNNRIRRLTPDGLISTITTPPLNVPRGVAVDDSGDIFIADTGNNRVLLVAADGTARVIAGTAVAGFGGDGSDATAALLSSPAGLFFDRTTGSLYVADSGNQRIRRLTPAPAAPVEAQATAVLVVNAATLLPGPVAPCSLVTIFASGAGAADTQILFDGQPTITTGQAGDQVSAQVPCAATYQISTLLQISYQGVAQPPIAVPVASAAPGIFALGGGTGQAVAANQDGTVNSQANPAVRGSVVTLYATGVGVNNSVGVVVGTSAGVVQFAGDAPGLVGLTQINVALPPDATGVQPVMLLAGNVPSQAGVTLAIE